MKQSLTPYSLASLQIELAQKLCSHECLCYHSAWPFLRAARLVGGVDADKHHLENVFTHILKTDGQNILLAGSADTALMSLVSLHVKPKTHLFLVDCCQTPLAVCRKNAPKKVKLTTIHTNLLMHHPKHHYQVIIGHSLLPFFSDQQRIELLKKFHSWLTYDGSLIMTVRKKQNVVLSETEQMEWVQQRALKAYNEACYQYALNDQKLPLSSTQLMEYLLGFYRIMSKQNLPYATEEEIFKEFETCGFTIKQIMQGGKGLSFIQTKENHNGVETFIIHAIKTTLTQGENDANKY